MSKLLDTISDIGGAASSFSAVGSAIKGVSGLLGIGRTDPVKQQKQLLDYQNKLNQQNATTAYERQRQLTQDSALLNKNGLRAAGQNTALGDASSTSAASVQQSAAPSASPLPTSSDIDSQYASMANNASSILQNHMSVSADARLKRSQAQLNETDALTRLSENATRLAKLRGEAKSADEKAIVDRLQREILQKFGMSNAELENNIKASEAIAAMADSAVRGSWNKAQYDKTISEIDLLVSQKGVSDEQKKNLKETRKNLIAERAEIASRTAKNYSDIKVNNANISNINEDTNSKKNENKLFNDTYSARIRAITKRSVPENLYQKIQMWRSDGTFEKLDGFQQLGYGIFEALTESGIKPSDALALLKFLK